MSNDVSNVYAAPQAELESVPSGLEVDHYAVSMKKFWVLTLGTMGLYEAYWFYKHWSVIKETSGEKIWPFWRMIFSIFFVHKLCRSFTAKVPNRDLGGIAIWYVLLSIVSQVMSRMSMEEVASPWTDIAGLIFVPISAFLLSKAQLVANESVGEEAVAANSSLTVANWFWLFLGGILWLLSIAGVAMYFFDLGLW
ncbi:hypothetical protein [Rubritalea sp.]|uniref:hypothetical protein n=1 Tax=Rubritalea sp. TaxID=2109375 RepID=UPI003EF71B4E